MPTFPAYHGPPLPNELRPLDPRHWWLLLTWVFFYPSRIKHYLYRADPELYVERGMTGWFTVLRQPAYRSLIITGFLTIAIVSFAFHGIAAPFGLGVDWRSVMYLVVISVMLGVRNGVVGIVAFGVAFAIGVAIPIPIVSFVVFGMAFGTAGSVAGGMAGAVALGVILGAMFGTMGTIMGGVGVLIGVLQLLAWFIEMIGLQRSVPLLSELGVLPFPGMMQYYRRRVVCEPAAVVNVLRVLLENSFRSHIAFHCLNHLLKHSTDPLTLLYAWLRDPRGNEYIFAPSRKKQFRCIPPLRYVLLGGLGNIFVDRTGGTAETSERVAWYIASRIYRSKPGHMLVSLAQLLLELEQFNSDLEEGGPEEDELEEMDFPLIHVLDLVTTLHTLSPLPHGDEIILTFELMTQTYRADSVTDIAQLQPRLRMGVSRFPAPLRPEVIEILAALADISRETVDYQQLSNLGAQGAALNRALGLLNELTLKVNEINLSERVLLQVIGERWQQLIAAEAGQIGDRALRELGAGARRNLVDGGARLSSLWQRPALPFANPYITGRPVLPPLFVGREDILNQIAERWRASHMPDSIILYGHRRMGKTSIVQNLAECAPAGSLLVYLDLAGAMATTEQMGDLLLDLAEKIHASAAARFPDLPQPQFTDYQQIRSADLHFQRLLRAVIDGLPSGAFLILALDEFEALEKAVAQGVLPSDAYRYLRLLSQQPRLTLVLAGLHTLDEMSRDYQQAFFSSYHNVRVSYLPLHEAERLIARPTPDFTLNYERSVIEAIHSHTYGQPLLIQSICSALVNHLNHQLFDLEQKREARILPADLEAILTDDFLRKESRYFEGVWRDQIADFPDQQQILHLLARHHAPLGFERIVELANLPTEQVNLALQALAKRDLVIEESGAWRLLMPLFQRWLRLSDLQDGSATE